MSTYIIIGLLLSIVGFFITYDHIYKIIYRWFVPTILLLLFLSLPLLAETIDVEYIDENRQSYNGCGVIYSPTICITAGHITNFKSNEPVIIKKDRKAINGTVKYVDSTADIAIIVLEKEIEAPTLVLSNGLAEQEVVQVDCFSRSRKLVYTSIGTNDVDGTEVYVFDGKVEPGMSGSPIYDNRKRLVSIVSGYAKKYNETVGCHPRSIKKALDNVLREH